MLRREWRQHVLVVTLLSVAVAAALFGAAAAHGVAPSHDGRFGLASHRFEISGDDPDQLDEFVADADAWFGGVDVIASRRLRDTRDNGTLGDPDPGSGWNPQRCHACGSRRTVSGQR